MVRLFRSEAACGGQVSHCHLVPILAAHVTEPPYYVVMPRIHGATVRTVLEACTSYALPQALWVVRQVAEAIGALHRGGWVHGDIKPGNVLADDSGHASLFDYGFATRYRQGETRDYLALQATLPYAAPELFTSSRRAGPASDVYSLGVMLFELIAGRRPFDSRQPGRLAEQHLREPPPGLRSFVPQVPRSVSQWVTRMLAKEPDRRPSSSGELQSGLVRLEAESFALRRGVG
jgi:serine/threonine-protein kinase